jgi:glycosyltransferase involved in cell wall biosynthesis
VTLLIESYCLAIINMNFRVQNLIIYFLLLFLIIFYEKETETYKPRLSLEEKRLGHTLRACTKDEGGSLLQNEINLLPPSVLAFSPEYPNWPPFHAGPCIVRQDEIIPGANAVFSILLNVWNREHQVRTALIQLFKLTREAWELIVVVDGATDASLIVVNDVINNYLEGWPSCGLTSEDVMANANFVWPSGIESTSVKNIGVECILNGAPASRLVRIIVVNIPKVGLLATFANNLQMRIAAAADHPAEFFVIVDDDQFMTVPGWNTFLAHPSRTFSDVFSVSARCAHGWPILTKVYGSKCSDSTAVQFPLDENSPDGLWRFFVADSGNRGPLLIRSSMAIKLGFLDEIHYAGIWTTGCDHDLNVRAYEYGNNKSSGHWVSGMFPIPYTEERCCRSSNTPESKLLSDRVYAWWKTRALSFPTRGPFGESNMHDETRFLDPLPLLLA